MFKVKYTWHVLAVQNLDQSLEYFTKNMGFETIMTTPDGKAFLKFDEFRVILGECPDEKQADKIGDHSYFAYVFCESVDSIYAQYKNRGVSFFSAIADKPWGMREFGVVTPDGHRMMFGAELSA